MKVRLLLDMFQTAICEMELDDSALIFSFPNNSRETIPFSQIRRFEAEGEGTSRKHFVLETDKKLYEGRFLQRGDAELLTWMLCRKTDCYVNFCLETPDTPKNTGGQE